MGFISDVIVSHEYHLGGYELIWEAMNLIWDAMNLIWDAMNLIWDAMNFWKSGAGSKLDWTKQDQSEKA